jgi:hypothetical protein
MKYDNLILHPNSKLVLNKSIRGNHCLNVNCVSSVQLARDACIDVNYCGRALNTFDSSASSSDGHFGSIIGGGAGFVSVGSDARRITLDRQLMSASMNKAQSQSIAADNNDQLLGAGGAIDPRSNIQNVVRQTVIGNCGGTHSKHASFDLTDYITKVMLNNKTIDLSMINDRSSHPKHEWGRDLDFWFSEEVCVCLFVICANGKCKELKLGRV